MYKNKRLIELISILTSVIEKNVTVECLTEFKISFFSTYPAFTAILKKQFPEMEETKIIRFINIITYYAIGLYPMTNQSEIQKQAIAGSGFPYQVPDFVKDYTEFIILVAEGLKS